MMNNQKAIPKDWVLGELIDFCIKSKRAIVDGPFGSNLKTEHFKKEGVPVINSSFVTELTFNANEYVYVDDELFQREIRSKVVPGDIVMAKIGARCGSSAILPATHPISILSGNSLKISIDENENSKEFVWFLLINEYLKNQFKDCKSVGAQPAISTPHLKKLKFPKPPLPEQKAIAQVLSTADTAIQTTEKLIAQKVFRKKWLMQQLLTGKTRLKGFGGEWKEYQLGDLGDSYNGLTGKTKENFGSGFPFITYMNVFSHSRIDITQIDLVAIEENENQNAVKYGDFFFTVSSETPNEVGMASVLLDEVENLYLNSFCFGFRLFDFETLNPIYAQFLLRFQSFREAMCLLAQGSTRFNISKAKVKQILLTLPPIEEQTAIAQVLQAADKEISLLKAKAEKLREQKKGLMQQLLTGKVRLKIN